MEISYTNLYNKIISKEQVNGLDDYTMIYNELGSVKMKENFDSGELYYIQYYKGTDETDQLIIDKFRDGQVAYSIIVKTNVGNFIIENILVMF
ncbi:hypothetical protein G6M26_23430 [Agrobacterium tumefaciens]|nr:hypothetical protein [Agrobacterium tumefaciens]NTE21496.1 hypothetical protein [Agrobacterium tumefaciens]